MYERILVPTDGSRAAEQASHFGVALAEAYGATVHVL
ncbi:universal stress protein (plasmid) [Haloferacaceae archaeon DSL9]